MLMKTIFLFISMFCALQMNAQGTFESAKEKFDSGNYLGAKTEIDQLLFGAKEKNQVRNWFLKVKIYAALLRDEQNEDQRKLYLHEASEAINKTKELASKSDAYYKLANSKLEMIWTDEINSGVSAMNSSEYKKAFTKFSNATFLKPENASSHIYRAYSAYRLEKYYDAKVSYEKLIDLKEMDENNFGIYYSCIQKSGGSQEEQSEILEKGLALFPNSKPLQQKKIDQLNDQRKYKELETLLQSYVQKNPEDASYRIQQGIVYETLYHNHFERKEEADAKKYFNLASNNYKSLVDNPDNETAFIACYNMASLMSYKANEYAMIANDMDIPTYEKEGAAVTELSKKSTQEALKYMLKANEKKPNHLAILSALKQFYTQLEDVEKVKEISAKIAKIQGE